MDSFEKKPAARKWTKENVSQHLANILRDSRSTDTLYLGKALANEGLYRQVWAHWKKLFTHDSDVLETMMIIETGFEARLFEGALTKSLSPFIAAMGLRVNHGWNDKKIEPETQMERRDHIVVHMDENTIMCINAGREPETYYRLPPTPAPDAPQDDPAAPAGQTE